MIIVTLPSNVWTNLYTAAGITAGQSVTMQVQAPAARIVLKAQLAQPDASDVSGIEAFEGDWYTFNASSEGAWVKPLTSDCMVAISTDYDKITPSRFGGRSILYGRTIDRLATQALNYRDDAIQRGLGYYSYYNQNIAAGAKSYIRFVCPADKYVVLIGRDIVMNKEALVYRAYSAFTGGTVGASIPIRSLRNDTAYPPTSTVNIMTAPTPTAGTDVTNLPIYGAVGTGQRVSGGSDSADTFRLLAPNSVFLIELENTSSSTNSVFTQFTWYELSNQVVL